MNEDKKVKDKRSGETNKGNEGGEGATNDASTEGTSSPKVLTSGGAI